jgi:hypothetical protein
MNFKIELNATVKDQVTGFTGVVTGRVEYLTGCRQYLVQPPVKKDKEFVNSIWMDEDRLQVTKASKGALTVKNAGPDAAAPVK